MNTWLLFITDPKSLKIILQFSPNYIWLWLTKMAMRLRHERNGPMMSWCCVLATRTVITDTPTTSAGAALNSALGEFQEHARAVSATAIKLPLGPPGPAQRWERALHQPWTLIFLPSISFSGSCFTTALSTYPLCLQCGPQGFLPTKQRHLHRRQNHHQDWYCDMSWALGKVGSPSVHWCELLVRNILNNR